MQRHSKIGERYGRLTVVAESDDGQTLQCLCDCGHPHSLNRGAWRKTQSCGCLRRDHAASLNTQHGMTGSPTYNSWQSMIRRCTNPRAADYDRYGGRGITVCQRWRDFSAFLDDMGVRPPGHTLDRVDNDRGYEPSNCRWATTSEQNLNRRPRSTCKRGHELVGGNVYVDGDGRRRCLACRRLRRVQYRKAS